MVYKNRIQENIFIEGCLSARLGSRHFVIGKLMMWKCRIGGGLEVLVPTGVVIWWWTVWIWWIIVEVGCVGGRFDGGKNGRWKCS